MYWTLQSEINMEVQNNFALDDNFTHRTSYRRGWVPSCSRWPQCRRRGGSPSWRRPGTWPSGRRSSSWITWGGSNNKVVIGYTEMVKKMGPRLQELAPAARGSQDAVSHNLFNHLCLRTWARRNPWFTNCLLCCSIVIVVRISCKTIKKSPKSRIPATTAKNTQVSAK